MINRRSFIIRSAGLLTLTLLDRFETYLANHGEPMLRSPKNPYRTIYVHSEPDHTISYHSDLVEADCAPDWQTFLTEFLGYKLPFSTQDFRRIREDWDVWPRQLGQDVPSRIWYPYWELNESPEAQAYVTLEKLDIDRRISKGDRTAGGIYFNDLGYHPGHIFKAAQCKDLLSVSLLQARLNELKTGLAIEMI